MSQTCECALNLPTSTFCRKLCQRFWLFFVGRIHMNLPVCKSKLLLLLWATNNVAWSKQPLKLLKNEATMFCSFSFTFFHKCFILFFLNKIFSWQSIKLNPGAHGSDSGGSGGREGVGGGYCHISLTYLNKGHCTVSRFETFEFFFPMYKLKSRIWWTSPQVITITDHLSNFEWPGLEIWIYFRFLKL